MFEQLVDLLRSIHNEGPSGIVILGCLALYLPAWAVLVWRGAERRAPMATGFVALFGVGAIGGGLALVSASRRDLRAAAWIGETGGLAVRPNSHWDRAMDAWTAVDRGEIGLLVLAIALLVTALFGVALVARKALSKAPPRPSGLALWACAFTLAGALSLVLLDRAKTALELRAENAISAAVFDGLVAGSLAAHHASRAVLAAGMILGVAIAAAVAWRAARPPAPPRPAAALAGVALFAAGIAAVIATRARAADAVHPIPSRDRLRSEWLFDEEDAGRDLDFLPDATRCQPFERDFRFRMPERYWTPIIRIDGPTATWENETFSDGAALGQRLVENHMRVWHHLDKDFRVTVVLRIGRDVRSADLARWARGLRDAPVDWVTVEAIQRRAPWPSRTLGEIPGGGSRCTLSLKWGAGDHAMSAFGTFADVVAEMERSPDALWAP